MAPSRASQAATDLAAASELKGLLICRRNPCWTARPRVQQREGQRIGLAARGAGAGPIQPDRKAQARRACRPRRPFFRAAAVPPAPKSGSWHGAHNRAGRERTRTAPSCSRHVPYRNAGRKKSFHQTSLATLTSETPGVDARGRARRLQIRSTVCTISPQAATMRASKPQGLPPPESVHYTVQKLLAAWPGPLRGLTHGCIVACWGYFSCDDPPAMIRRFWRPTAQGIRRVERFGPTCMEYR